MSAVQCVTCRWWNGDREYAPKHFREEIRHGKCEKAHAGAALRPDTPFRIYPVGSGAWVSTRFDFSCGQWEKDASVKD